MVHGCLVIRLPFHLKTCHWPWDDIEHHRTFFFLWFHESFCTEQLSISWRTPESHETKSGVVQGEPKRIAKLEGDTQGGWDTQGGRAEPHAPRNHRCPRSHRIESAPDITLDVLLEVFRIQQAIVKFHVTRFFSVPRGTSGVAGGMVVVFLKLFPNMKRQICTWRKTRSSAQALQNHFYISMQLKLFSYRSLE